MPVNTPFGSACMLYSVDRKIGAVHAAQIATATFFRGGDVGRMVSLGVKGRRKREHLGGAKFDTEPTPFASFDSDGDGTLSHVWPPVSFLSNCGKGEHGRCQIEIIRL